MLLVFALLTSSCGMRHENNPTPSPTLSPTPIPTPKPGGELKFPMPENANITNPLTVNTEELMLMFSMVFESLIRLDGSNKPVSSLAESWNIDSETGKTFTIKLRSNVYFHGSSALLKADDVVYTIDKIKELGSDSYYAYNVSLIESASAINDTTLKITMKVPGISSLYLFTFPIIKTDADLTATPIGTGAYEVQSATGTQVLLRANPKWWKQAPYITNIAFIPKLNNETAIASYEAGQLNFVPTSVLSIGRYREDGVTNIADLMTQNVELMLFNSNNAALSDIAVRKALAYAIDRSSVISNTYMNRAQTSDVPIAPDSFLYDSKSMIFEHNSEYAAKLLKEAGYSDTNGDGILEKGAVTLSFNLLVNDTIDSSARKNAADAYAEQLKKCGILITVVTAEYSLASVEETKYITMLKNGEFDIALIGVNLPQNFDLSALLSETGERNYGKMYDAELYAKAVSITAAVGEAESRIASSEFSSCFIEKLPFLTLYFRLNSIIYTAKLQGLFDMREPDITRNVEKWWFLD